MKRHRAVRRRKQWEGRGPGKPPFTTELSMLGWENQIGFGQVTSLDFASRVVAKRGKRIISSGMLLRGVEIEEHLGDREALNDLIEIQIEMALACVREYLPDHRERVRARRVARYLKACAARKHVRLGLICSE